MTIDNYKHKFVAFIDILGFKALVENIEGKAKTYDSDFKKVFSALNFLDNESTSSDGNHDLPVYDLSDQGLIERELGNPVITYVSDCAVVSTDGTFDGFKGLCNKLTKFSTDLAADGIFLRGAVTYGKVFHTGRILFGTGYQNAFKLETTKAINPRIIIDDSVLEFLRSYDGQFPLSNAGVRESGEDKIRYLRIFPFNYFPYYTGSWLDYLLRVKSHLLYYLNMYDNRVEGFGTALRNLDRFCCWKEKYTYGLDFTGGNASILKKYIWLSEEFNETLETYSVLLSNEKKELRISKIIFDGNLWKPEKELGHYR
jgi:hypothetical protein